MLCGRCCVTEPPTKLALRLDIFIEILPRTRVNRGCLRSPDSLPKGPYMKLQECIVAPNSAPLELSAVP
jgi:hypothetical protein